MKTLSKERHQELMDILERTSMRPKGAKPPEYPQEYKDYRTLCTEEVVKRTVDGYEYTSYIYRAKDRTANCPVHINIHGGGFVVPHMECDTLYSCYLASRLHGIVVDLDYTTSPVAPWPVAFDQCYDAAADTFAHCSEWGGNARCVSIGGYSAGGHLTSAVVLHLLQQGRAPFAMQALCYSPADMSHGPTQDPQTNFEKRSIAFEALVLDGDESLRQDPVFNPACAADSLLAQFPATLLITAGKCPFRDQDEAFAQRLIRLGVETTVRRFPEASHGFIPHFTQCWEGGAETLARHICAARA